MLVSRRVLELLRKAGKNGKDVLTRLLRGAKNGEYIDDVARVEKMLASGKTGNVLDQTQEAMQAFRKNKEFRRWWHRKYKASQKIPKVGKRNPDLPKEDILDGYLEWLELGKPKG